MLKELKRTRHVSIGHRASIGSAQQPRQDALGAGLFFTLLRGCAVEDPLPARSIAGALRVERARHRHRVHGRLLSSMAIEVEARLVRLPLGLHHRRRLLDESYTDLVRTSRHGQPHPKMLVDQSMPAPFGGGDGEQAQALSVEQDLNIVRLVESFDLLVSVTRKPDRDLVLGIHRERVRGHRAAARTDR